jgi:hypothetical protein
MKHLILILLAAAASTAASPATAVQHVVVYTSG